MDATVRIKAQERLQDSAAEQVVAALTTAQGERMAGLGRHSSDLAELAVAVGRRSGLDTEEIALLSRAAGLHDIGKLAVPDAILEKPGPLTEDEMAIVHEHPVIGARIIAMAPGLEGVAGIVRSSHERYDGNGYPDGLAGDEIPRMSRILLVCDAFCAMTRPRPYSRALSPREALVELRRRAGEQFDPAIVTAFGQTLAAGAPA